MNKSNNIALFLLLVVFFIAIVGCNSNMRNCMISPGLYENHGTSIIVEGTDLKISYCSPHSILDGFIIADCRISHLCDNFYSIHSKDVPQGMFDNVTVEYNPGVQTDSALLIFNFPNLNWEYFDKLKIIINETLSTIEYTQICDSNNFAIKLPRMKKYFASFAPLEYVSYNAMHNYHGLLQFDDYRHVYDTKDQDLIITMPNVTMDMFYRWYLDDVILRVEDEAIQLFGVKYKKIK